MVICLERVADLHMVQLMPLPLTVSCFSKIQIGFAFLVLAYPGSPGKRVVKWVCVCVCVCVFYVRWDNVFRIENILTAFGRAHLVHLINIEDGQSNWLCSACSLQSSMLITSCYYSSFSPFYGRWNAESPRHYSKDLQCMADVLCHSSCHDKHSCLPYNQFWYLSHNERVTAQTVEPDGHVYQSYHIMKYHFVNIS